MDEFDIGKYSLYNEKNIIFSSNSVFKCIYIDKINNKIIFKFIRNATWNPLLYLTRENKKLFGIVEDGFRYLTEEQRKQIFIARIKNKEIKFIYGLSNLRELELYDDSEPKADISVFTSYFNQFKKLKCLTIIGNNMSNKECASLSNGLKFLKELKILNLSFNSLTDNNISKLTFNIYNKIEALNLKSNSITEQSLEVFKDELSKLKNLKEFNILDNQFGDQGFYHLLQSFVWLTELRVLIIANCNISNNGINKFYDMMKLNQNFLKKLEIINLTSNVMSDKCLPTFINIIKNLPNLRRFSITQAQITNKGMKLIYNNLKEINKNWIFDQNGGWFTLVEDEAIEEKKFNQLAEFNEMPVVFNEIRINYLKKNRKKLQNKIHFEFSNCDIRNKNIIFEFEKELINFSNIRIFNFSYNYNISLPGYEALSQGFKKLPNLSKLILSSNNISDKAFEYIYSIFDKCKNISSIDMSNNNITNSGFANFCLSLTKNEIKINEIDFYNNKIGNDGFKTLCEESKNNTFIYLKKLNLSKNKLGNESMKDFTMNYSKFENLIELDLSYNNLGDEIVLYFNPQILNELVDIIRIIDISNNKLSNEVKNFFKESGIPFNILY
jgi:Ran GTPase-activating protein (RanGAP) involved in mRNA processing and transport